MGGCGNIPLNGIERRESAIEIICKDFVENKNIQGGVGGASPGCGPGIWLTDWFKEMSDEAKLSGMCVVSIIGVLSGRSRAIIFIVRILCSGSV